MRIPAREARERARETHLTAKALPVWAICADAPLTPTLGSSDAGGATPPRSSASTRSVRPDHMATEERGDGRAA
jgi:hypothetical protein